MSYIFEVILQGTAKDLFHHAFANHMEKGGYSLTHLGGGGRSCCYHRFVCWRT